MLAAKARERESCRAVRRLLTRGRRERRFAECAGSAPSARALVFLSPPRRPVPPPPPPAPPPRGFPPPPQPPRPAPTSSPFPRACRWRRAPPHLFAACAFADK